MQNQEFRFKPSVVYSVFIISICLASLGMCMTLPLSLLVRLGGGFIILVYGFVILRRYALLQSRFSITSIRFKTTQTWLITLNKETLAAELQGESVVTGKIAILRFKLPDKWFSLSAIVLKDSLPHDKYRQLLVLLK